MALPTFILPRPPGVIDETPVLDVLSFEKGDGYTAETPNGLNHIRRVLKLQWRWLTVAQEKLLVDFLVARGGTKPFAWTPSLETATLVWTCREWSRQTKPAVYKDFTCTLRQSFTLEI